MTDTLNVLLTSAGRRPYLVQWFREALRSNGLNGRVILSDADHVSAAQAFADVTVTSVPAHDPMYATWIEQTLEKFEIGLAISVNDFELSEWARLPFTSKALVRFSEATQALVEDKYVMAQRLNEAGIPVPTTALPSEIDLIRVAHATSEDVVIKSRFGSGSRGLRIVNATSVDEAIDGVASEVYDRTGHPPVDPIEALANVVVQPRIVGQEFGLDIVNDLSGNYVSVLARQKLTMRAGETDKAVTVDPGPFKNIAKDISAIMGHPGLIDVDVINDTNGKLWVIDINPRFGGGYPFSHVAGADIPAAYVAWASGRVVNPQWLRSRVGVTAAKYVEITPVADRK